MYAARNCSLQGIDLGKRIAYYASMRGKTL